MQFKEQKSIYLQIADHMVENIIVKVWKNGERIPSIRETAIQMEVNPNTVMRTYNYLQDKGVIFNKRGIGYFTAPDALEHVLAEKKKIFIQQQLPELFKAMRSLQITPKEILSLYEKSEKELHNENQ
ncbi:MAG: GntR family transcriptional regulator [Spirochaetales bacterium]|nr:GntR family transcriptional regulator [Spirochaetales bacterium]